VQIVKDKIYFNLPDFAEMSMTDDLLDYECQQGDVPMIKLRRFLVEPSLPQEISSLSRNDEMKYWRDLSGFKVFRDVDRVAANNGPLFQFVCLRCWHRVYLEEKSSNEACLYLDGVDGGVDHTKFEDSGSKCVAKCHCREVPLPEGFEAFYD
jgi:hypothetical protein